ncbi:hypothetical protein QL285_029377 [Trifolium repens]|nr:hypothetical protein QL285_029377 [Trifolium repens]
MNIKYFIFVLYLCALLVIPITAIELSKDEKQFGATKESSTKIGDRGRGRGHVDGGWGFWGNWGPWKGWLEWTGFGGGPKGKGKPVGNEGGGGGGGGGGAGGRGKQPSGWERVQNERPKWGGEEGRAGENRGTRERPWIPSTWIHT